MAEVNSTDHLVRPEKDTLVNGGHDNEGFPRGDPPATNGHPLNNGHPMEEAVVSFSSGRVRVKKPPSEAIPLEPLPEKKNGGWEEVLPEKQLTGNGKADDLGHNHRKCLSREGSLSSCSEHKSTGEKLYFTEESRKLCPGWRRLLICGLILIMIAIALLLGVLAATGILLSKSDSKNTRYESGHSLPNMDSIAHAGHSFRPRPSSSKVPQKFQPPVTVEHSPNATPATMSDNVHDTVSQAPSTVTSKVPPLLNDSSHSQTIVPNALVGEFKIINENFADDLYDPYSRGYRNIADNLEKELRRIFVENNGQFQQIKILNFRPGSIKVKFVVVWSSDKGIIISEKATEILKADLRKKNNSFYNMFYVDANSIHFMDVFDECRVQKGGCSFDCNWNYDTLQKNCMCPMDMYLLSDGKSCAPKPKTSSTESVPTSSSPQSEPFSPTTSTIRIPQTTPELSWSSQETRPHFDSDETTTSNPTNVTYPVTISEHYPDVDFKPKLMTTTEKSTSNVQTYPVEHMDIETTTQGPRRGSVGIGEDEFVFKETTTEKITLFPHTETTRVPPSYRTEPTVRAMTDTTPPSSFREDPEYTEPFSTEARETFYPNYETTMNYGSSPQQPASFQTEISQDQTRNPPTTKSSTLKYHIPDPTTEVYTWRPHYDYNTEAFNPPAVTDTYPTDYTTEKETTFPVTDDTEKMGTETAPNVVKMMTEPATTTTATSIKREGTWQEGQTFPTTFDGRGVWDGQTDSTTEMAETSYETTYFPQIDNQTTVQSTTLRQDLSTQPNSTFPSSLQAFNRTPAVRSYDNFTDYYDNSTYVGYNGTETMVPDTTTDSSGTEHYARTSPDYSTYWYWSTPKPTDQFNDTISGNEKPINESGGTFTTGFSSSSAAGFTVPNGFFNVTETAEPEVTDETPNPTFQTERNTNSPFTTMTEPHITETPVNFSGGNFTREPNTFTSEHIYVGGSLNNVTTLDPEGNDTEITTFNPSFPRETTLQFPSTPETESHYPSTDTTGNNREMTTTTDTIPPFNIHEEANFREPKPFGNDSETTFPPMTTTYDQDMTEGSMIYDFTETVASHMPQNSTSDSKDIVEADSELTTTPVNGKSISIDQSETITSTYLGETTFGMDQNDTTVTSEGPSTREIPMSTDYGTDYPQKSAKSETESTSFYGSEGSSFSTYRPPETEPQTTYPRETTLNFQTEAVTTRHTTPFQIFPLPGLKENETTAYPTTFNPTEQSETFPTETEHPGGTATLMTDKDYPTTQFAETFIPIFIVNGSETPEGTYSTTLPTETEVPMVIVSENSSMINDSFAVTEQSTLVTTKVSLTDSSIGTETVTTSASTDLSSSNSNDKSIVLSVDITNGTFHKETTETSLASFETTLPTGTLNTGSEFVSTLDSNSTLPITPLPTSSDDSTVTDITGYPYDLNESTTIAPYTLEDTTIVSDSEFSFNQTNGMNSSSGNSTDEFGALYPEGLNATDYNYTFENANITTTPGYDMLNETTTNASVGVVCREDQFICEPLNICLNFTFECDGIRDCPDGIDESDCQESCHTNFKCSNTSNMCIMSSAQCDGIWDCENGTDEEFCKPSECAKHEVMCSDQSKCIRPSDICDLKYDCNDRSDEVGCVERTTCESGGKFFCNDGLCIPWSLKCDGEFDCKDKEDEGNCTCLNDEYQCNDGKCLKSSSRCDGHRDCHDGGDEMGCVNVDSQHLVMTYEPYSGSWAMLCAEDWTLDDGHYLCQELGFGHALKTEKQHVSFNGTWMAMRRENLTDASLWTERVSFVESCTSSLAASVECQKFACGEYSGLLHRRRRRDLESSSSTSSQWPFVGYTSTFYSTKGCLSEILTPIWLITSADCLLSISKQPFNGSDWYVRTNIGQSTESGSVQNHEVLRIMSHPHSSKFRSLTIRDYDVALIRLKHALVFVSDKIGAICPPEEQVPLGITCFSGVLGMQVPRGERAPPPTTLAINSLALQIIDRKNCNSVDHYNNLINQRMLCTQSSEGHTICDNDEGTPLMCLSGINKWFLAGMLSYQRYCEIYSKHPPVFSNLFQMRKFIDQVTGQKQYEISYNSNVYVIIPPTTPSPTIPETTTVMYTTESMSTDTTVSDFTTLMDEYTTTLNATIYDDGSVTFFDNFTESSTTSMELYDETTLPKDEFIEVRGDENVTTLSPITVVDSDNATELNNETTYMPLWNATALDLAVSDNTTSFSTPGAFTDIPLDGVVTLDGETTFNSDNSTMDPKMFEPSFVAHVDSQFNNTRPGDGNFAAYILPDNNTEMSNATVFDYVNATMQTQPNVPGMLMRIEPDSNSSMTRMPVMSMGNETMELVMEPEKLILVTSTKQYDETTSSPGETFPTVIDSDAKDLTTTERPFWKKEETYMKGASVEPDYKMIDFTDRPLMYKGDATMNDQFKETETTTFSENPNEETTTMKTFQGTGTFTEPILKMENRAESFELLRGTTTPGFGMKETTTTESITKETSPVDFSIKETIPNLNEKATTLSYSDLQEATTEPSAFHTDLTKSALFKETISTDLGVEETETTLQDRETTLPTETTSGEIMEHSGLSLNPKFVVITTTQPPETTTPASETRTLMFETEVATDGDIALIAFNDSDGIVMQPAESPDAVANPENRSHSMDHLFRGRSYDQLSNQSEIVYDTSPTSYKEYPTTPLTPDTTGPTTEWDEYYSTLTTPSSVDEVTTITEATQKDTVTAVGALVEETTTRSPVTELTSSEATSEYDESGTDSSAREFRVSRVVEDFEKCGAWSHPSNLTHNNSTKFYKEWPALGYLQLIQDTKLCPASLISPYILIASLNCLSVKDPTLNGEKWAYVGGLHHPDPTLESQQTHLVADILPYANITISLLFRENNVALVRLKHPVILNKFARKACLPEGEIQLEDQRCYTAGWSEPEAEGGKSNFISRPVKIISHEECNSTRNYNGLLLESLTCATYHKTYPTCLLDSGSPLFCLNNEQWELRGLLSFANSCDLIQPAVYNSLTNIRGWIQDIVSLYSS